ncbi:SRPBCC family protein [Nocardia tengchongensis]|uniref:SRPBCC family protein n=1 Tax=Nocardia tengchongensis TaxID=2055889 RepID=A0ABX8CTE0_9NOCA|nr:SRPBCC family protein [Nocardia tengchongensis]QVI23182.1 SRPBCC family protein [Nocardia tengchongensis]
MRTVDVERTIAAPPADVFDWLTDVANYQRVPLVRRVTLVRPGNTAGNGVGAVRLVVTPLMRLTQEITEYDPPRLMRYRGLKSVPRLRHQEGFISCEPVAGGTRVHWSTSFELAAPALSPLWTTLSVPVVRASFEMVLRTAARELRGA